MKSHFAAIGVGVALAAIVIAAFMALAPVIGREIADGDGVVSVDLGDASGSYALKDKGREASARWEGDFEITADASGFVTRGGDFAVDMTIDGARRRATWSAAGVQYAEGGAPFASGVDAEAKAAALLRDFARISGMNAERRIIAIAEQGGVAAALAEADAATSDGAALSFIEAIVGLDAIAGADLERLFARARQFDGDYERRRAFGLIFAAQSASDAVRADIISAAADIDPSHELRLFIEEAAIDADTARALIPLIEEIDDDRDARRAIESLVEAGAVAQEDIAAIGAIIGDFEDAREARIAIEATYEAAAEKPAVRALLLDVASKLGDDEERARAEEALQ